MTSTTITTTSQTLWRILESYGLDAARVFREAGLDPEKWQEPGSRYDDDKLDAAWLRAIELSQDPCIGLRFARYFNPASLQSLGFAWLASDSLYDAMSRLVRYARVIVSSLELELTLSGEECCLAFSQTDPQWMTEDEIRDAFWAGLINMCRISLTESYAPLRLTRCRPEPPCVADFYALFRAPIQFAAGRDAMIFRREDVERPLPTANHLLARTNERIVADYMARLDDKRFPDRVRACLVEMMPAGTGAGLALHRRGSDVDQGDHLPPGLFRTGEFYPGVSALDRYVPQQLSSGQLAESPVNNSENFQERTWKSLSIRSSRRTALSCCFS
jgi:hypothetical protein